MLRSLKKEDLELLMAWRSNPLIYKYFYLQNMPLTWERHIEWWWTNDIHRFDYMIIYNGRKIGSVNIVYNSAYPEIGIYIGEITLWGKGIGEEVINVVLNKLRKYYRGASANIMDNNKSSIRLFTKIGFKKIRENRNGESYYRIEFGGNDDN